MSGCHSQLLSAVLVSASLALGGCQYGGLTAGGPAGSEESFRVVTVDRDERIVADVRINGRSARLGLDTGTGVPFVLFAPAVQRLGLKVAEQPAPDINPSPGHANIGFTVPATFDILNQRLHKQQFGFVEVPAWVDTTDLDGFMGWPAISENLWGFFFSGETPVISTFAADPNRYKNSGESWLTFSVSRADTLSLRFSGSGAGGPRLIIDTGNSGGVLLSPTRWREWKAAHPDAPATLAAGYMPGQKLAAKEVAWADKLQVGGLVFYGVPVEEADAAYMRKTVDAEEIVVLGLAALKRLDLVVDGRAGTARARSLQNPPPPFPHNRVGVDFLPKSEADDDCFAQVHPSGPAYRAGLRDGDVLHAVNGERVPSWRTNSTRWRKLFNSKAPPGTEWEFTVVRDGAERTVTVVAEDLLGPGLKRRQ